MSPIDIFQFQRVLAIQPHADDNELCIAGTVARLIAGGASVTYATVTDGARGSQSAGTDHAALATRRKAEQERALRTLGGSESMWLGFPDGGPHNLDALRATLVNVIRRVRPDLVITCDPWLPYEAHVDHIACGLATARAMLHSGHAGFGDDSLGLHSAAAIAFYATPAPNTIIDVSGVWDKKMQALRCHESQFENGGVDVFVDRIRQHAEAVGAKHGYRYAEALRLMTRADLHLPLPLP